MTRGRGRRPARRRGRAPSSFASSCASEILGSARARHRRRAPPPRWRVARRASAARTSPRAIAANSRHGAACRRRPRRVRPRGPPARPRRGVGSKPAARRRPASRSAADANACRLPRRVAARAARGKTGTDEKRQEKRRRFWSVITDDNGSGGRIESAVHGTQIVEGASAAVSTKQPVVEAGGRLSGAAAQTSSAATPFSATETRALPGRARLRVRVARPRPGVVSVRVCVARNETARRSDAREGGRCWRRENDDRRGTFVVGSRRRRASRRASRPRAPARRTSGPRTSTRGRACGDA